MITSKELRLRDVIDGITKAKGWTQTVFARELGISQSRLSKMRTGEEWQEHWEIALKLLELSPNVQLQRYRRIVNDLRSRQQQFDFSPKAGKKP